MTEMLRRLLQVLLPLVVLALGVWQYQRLAASREEAEPVVIEVQPPAVEIAVAAPAPRVLLVPSQGTVQPPASLRPAAEVSGTLARLHPNFAAGGRVRAGEALIELDRREFELAVIERRALLLEAQATLLREEAEAEAARGELLRAGVAEPGPLALREPQLAQASARVASAQAGLERAELDLERTTWRAPFDALVERRDVELGQFLRAGEPLGELFAAAEVEVRLPLSDRDLALLDLDERGELDVAVTLEGRHAGRPRTWQARVARFEARLDTRSRTRHAIARLEARPGEPLPEVGAFLFARLEGRRVPAVSELPLTALRGENEVLVLDHEDRIHIRRVEVLQRGERTALIGAGLAAGERVVTTTLAIAVPGMRVRVLEVAPGAGAATDGDGGDTNGRGRTEGPGR